MKKAAVAIVGYLMIGIVFVIFAPSFVIRQSIIYAGGALVFMLPIYFYLRIGKRGQQLVRRIRGLCFAKRTAQRKAKGLMISEGVRFHGKKSIKIGDNVSIDARAEFFPSDGGAQESSDFKIIVGDNVHIGAYNRFASVNKVEIEEDVLFAAFVHVTDHSHEFRDIELPIRNQGVFTKGDVKICKGAWLGLRCSILSGVTIGQNAVVAAGAIVTKDVPPYSVVAGCPARVIQEYDFNRKEWVNV